MKHGRLNLIVGALTIFIGGIVGFFLAFSLDAYFADGFYAMPYTRSLLKGAHTHAMPLAIYNLALASIIGHLVLRDRYKKIASISGACTLFMPVGLLLRGIDNGALTFVPVVMIGVLGLFISAAFILKGALAITSDV